MNKERTKNKQRKNKEKSIFNKQKKNYHNYYLYGNGVGCRGCGAALDDSSGPPPPGRPHLRVGASSPEPRNAAKDPEPAGAVVREQRY